ncbi:MAG: LamG-like jellyroll fold domain-containing protein, partial [Pseudomonadota bacterium]
DDLDQAITPLAVSEDTGPIAPPTDLPTYEDFGLVNGKSPVFGLAGPMVFDGDADGAYEAGHAASMEVANGTLALTFRADEVSGTNTLFSKDGYGLEDGGHLTAWIKDGEIKIRQQTAEKSEHLVVPDVAVEPGVTHHLAVSFGEAGLKVYLDGQLVAAEPTFKQGLETNDRSFLVGASGIHRKDDGQDPRDGFDGTIADVMLYDSQLEPVDLASLAGDVDPTFEMAALMALGVEDLMPAFTQLHHGSEEAKALAQAYGFTHHGHMSEMRPIEMGTDGADTLAGDGTDEAINGGLGDDSVDGGAGDDMLQGFYGNDVVSGGAGNDVLDGGHGEDVLDGGEGDDLLISQADAREPEIADVPGRDEEDPYNELTDGKLYPDQPIPADDVLTGGAGADTFYFQTLINAKERYIEKHTNDDGTIRWHGVAGENDKLHDHWVDGIGDDVITDFDRGEGDRIVIEGHTTEIQDITYGDANGDGVVDHSVISLYSDQGNNGGAHQYDQLGTITVYGDLVTEADISQDAGPAYGIVKTIDDLDQAITPLAVSEDTGPIAPPTDLPFYEEGDPAGALMTFFLVDTVTDQIIAPVGPGGTIDPALLEGKKVSLAGFPTDRAPEIGSVQLTFDGRTQTENVVPYTLLGDIKGDYRGDADFGLGEHSVSIAIFSEKNGKGNLLTAMDLTFTVSEVPVDDGGASDGGASDGGDDTGGDDTGGDSGDETGGLLDSLIIADDFVFDVTKEAGERVIEEQPDFAVADGTVFMRFTAEDAEDRGRDVLFSREGRGLDEGEMMVFVKNGHLIARVEGDEGAVRLRAKDAIKEGEEQSFALSFDGEEVNLYVDGLLAASKEFDATWEETDGDLMLGANNRGRSEARPEWAKHRFEGEISEFALFGEAIDEADAQALANGDVLIA